MIYSKVLIIGLVLVARECRSTCSSSDEEVEARKRHKVKKINVLGWEEDDSELNKFFWDEDRKEKSKDFDSNLLEPVPVGLTTWPNETVYSPKHGFKNINSSCFINATLQALLANDLIAEVLVAPNLREYCLNLKKSKLMANQALVCALVDLIADPRSKDSVLFVQETLGLAWPDWNNPEVRKRQQDAAEILDHLIEYLKLELAPYVQTENHRFDMFTGRLRSVISVPDKESTIIFQPFNVISIPLKEETETGKREERKKNSRGKKLKKRQRKDKSKKKFKTPLTLKKLLKKYKQTEILKDYGNAKKTEMISELPSVLILHFKRFTNSLKRVEGIIKSDPFIDLRSFISDATSQEPIIYELYSVIVQKGDYSRGHFYTYVKKHVDGSIFWEKRDDSTIRIVSEKTVFLDEHYIQFYRRMRVKAKD